MRDRELIEKAFDVVHRTDNLDGSYVLQRGERDEEAQRLVLEVLLDIREILVKEQNRATVVHQNIHIPRRDVRGDRERV